MKVPITPSGMVAKPSGAGGGRGPLPIIHVPRKKTPRGLSSLVLRVPRWKLEAVKALSRETRVKQSEYLREAIEDLLRKHGAL